MAAPTRYWEDVKEGDALPEVKVANLTRTDFVKYAGASGDFNPIHHDQTFAEASGNPTVFAMGMLNASILSRVVTGFAGRPNVRSYRARFATRAWPGDDVICRGTVTRKFEQDGEKRVEGELSAVTQKGETLITRSSTAARPSRPSRRRREEVARDDAERARPSNDRGEPGGGRALRSRRRRAAALSARDARPGVRGRPR